MARVSQTQQVYNSIKKKIEDGVYSPAENLPEMELSAEYGVSRNTVKKALLMLETDALVVIEQNKGAKVRSFSKAEVLECLDLREELEGYVIRLAVPCFDQDTLCKMEVLLEEMHQYLEQSDLLSYSAGNQRFHQIVYDVCPSKVAVDTLLRLKTQLRKYNGKTILVPGRGDTSYQEHLAILRALQAQDTVMAEQNMRKHIHSVRMTFEQYYALLF